MDGARFFLGGGNALQLAYEYDLFWPSHWCIYSVWKHNKTMLCRNKHTLAYFWKWWLPFLQDPLSSVIKLEVDKCGFTFSSEIRQIQCSRTEFWYVQCVRGSRGQVHWTSIKFRRVHWICLISLKKEKCKFINLIHTWQKDKIICSCLWKIINKMALKCH